LEPLRFNEPVSSGNDDEGDNGNGEEPDELSSDSSDTDTRSTEEKDKKDEVKPVEDEVIDQRKIIDEITGQMTLF
jgi:hypothetical protein